MAELTRNVSLRDAAARVTRAQAENHAARARTKTNVYFSDFAHFPGLKERLNHFVCGKQPCLEIVQVAAQFITVQGPSVFIRALYQDTAPHRIVDFYVNGVRV
jgi:hypothetical protein